jgi:hypothetical protein
MDEMFVSTRTLGGRTCSTLRERNEGYAHVERHHSSRDGGVVACEILAHREDPPRPVRRRPRLRGEEAVVDRDEQRGHLLRGQARQLEVLVGLSLAEADHPRGRAERPAQPSPPRRRRAPPDQVQAEVHHDDGQTPQPGRERKPCRTERSEDDVDAAQLERDGELARVPGDPLERLPVTAPGQQRVVVHHLDSVLVEIGPAVQHRVRVGVLGDSCEQRAPRVRVDERRPHRLRA